VHQGIGGELRPLHASRSDLPLAPTHKEMLEPCRKCSDDMPGAWPVEGNARVCCGPRAVPCQPGSTAAGLWPWAGPDCGHQLHQ
jgi:hypothetical protein